MKTKFFVLFLSLLPLIFNSCKNKDCTKDGTCPPEYFRFRLGEARAYLWAKPGSYWIYKNTTTGELDTQICIGFLFDSVTVKGTEDDDRHITIEYDKLTRTVQSSFNKWTYYEKTDSHTPSDDDFANYKTKIIREVAGEGRICSFFNPFIKDGVFGDGVSNTKCLGVDSMLIIQSKTYYGISKFELDLDGIWYPDNHPLPTRYPNTIYYWAKDVGLIKMLNKSENYAWELMEYNIKP